MTAVLDLCAFREKRAEEKRLENEAIKAARKTAIHELIDVTHLLADIMNNLRAAAKAECSGEMLIKLCHQVVHAQELVDSFSGRAKSLHTEADDAD
jgi:hypothetical protein